LLVDKRLDIFKFYEMIFLGRKLQITEDV